MSFIKKEDSQLEDQVFSVSSSNPSRRKDASKWQNFKDSFQRADDIEEDDEELELGEYKNATVYDDDDDSKINGNQMLQDMKLANKGVSKTKLSKSLKNRHLQMIAIGGAVGTGLLIGSGGSLRTGGPAALIIAWGLVGTMVFCIMHALGELAIAFPVSGAFSSYATRFVDPSWGFAVGWNYAIMWLIVLPLELVAAAMSITYWNDKINPVAWVAIFYFVIIFINIFGVRGYGEAEFFMSLIKVIAIIGFVIFSFIIVVGGGPSGEFIGAKRWNENGSFTNGFKGVCTVFVTASYSLAGTELVGLAAAELENPRKALPKAIKQVFWRIFLFYFVSLTFIGLLVPSNSKDLLGGSSSATSPFVLAIKYSGVSTLPSIFNAVILMAVISVGNAAVYGCSRTLQSLGVQGLGPSFLSYVDKKGRPLGGLLVSLFFGLLCFLSGYKNESEVFAWLLSVSGLSTLFSWLSIGLCHLRFRAAMKKQKRELLELTFISFTGIWGSIYSIGFLIVVLGLQFWIALFPIGSKGVPNAKNFFQNYLGCIVILIFYVGHKLYRKNWKFYIPLEDIDLDSGRKMQDIELVKAELVEEAAVLASKPLYYRIYHFWC